MLSPVSGKTDISPGGLYRRMAEEPFDLVDVRSLLEKVSSKTVTQGMDALGMFYAGFFLA